MTSIQIQDHDVDVTQLDGTAMKIEGTGQLPLHQALSQKAQQGNILWNLRSYHS